MVPVPGHWDRGGIDGGLAGEPGGLEGGSRPDGGACLDQEPIETEAGVPLPSVRVEDPDRRPPARWTGPHEITVVDLDIDVVRHRRGRRVEVEDEDEFEEHRVSLGYPDEIVAGALRGAAAVREALLSDAEPFPTHYRGWLARV